MCHVTVCLQDERNFTEDEEVKLQAVFALEAKDLELALETVSFFLEQVQHDYRAGHHFKDWWSTVCINEGFGTWKP